MVHYNHIHPTSTSGSGTGLVANVTTDGSSTSVTIYHGGYGYAVSRYGYFQSSLIVLQVMLR